jgi:hypothetical protein
VRIESIDEEHERRNIIFLMKRKPIYPNEDNICFSSKTLEEFGF